MKKKHLSTELPKSYWNNAAKQISWPIDHNDKQILVPEDELQLAEDDLMVMHFRKYGWHIQSSIIQHTKPFIAPTTKGPIFRGDLKKEVVEAEPLFKCNDKFRIQSTGTEVMIVEYTKKSISLKYTSMVKDNIITSPENLAKSVKMGVFVRI